VNDNDASACPSPWLPDAVAAIVADPATTIPPIDAATLAPILPGIDLWDLWPLQNADGSTTVIDGWALWFVLSAPVLADPDARHDVARIRLLAARTEDQRLIWRDLGPAFPDGYCPGSREWAGSALFDPEARRITLFWTAAGRRGAATRTFEQRLFAAHARLAGAEGGFALTDWSAPRECVIADGRDYLVVGGATGVPGAIKGFRDPAHWRDPASGATYLLFTGSLAASASAWNGCIGIARADAAAPSGWALLPPVVSADLLNNEMERPHIVAHGGQLYLFWSTQRHVFAADGPTGPNGLYAMVADRIEGPWRPVNGTGLVAGNPADAPYQAYSWWVEDDLTVSGFADFPGVAPDGKIDTAAWRRAHYSGTPAPLFRIVLAGETARVDHAWQPPRPEAAKES